MVRSLEQFKEVLREEAFGPQKKKGVCVSCREPPVFGENVYIDAGRQEFGISGLCEDCFDEITKEED